MGLHKTLLASVIAAMGGGFTNPSKYYFIGQRAHTPSGMLTLTSNNHTLTRIYLGVTQFPAHSFRMAFPGHTNNTNGLYPVEATASQDITIQGVAIGYSDTKDPTTATFIDGAWSATIVHNTNKTGLLSTDIISSGSPIPAGKHVWAQWAVTAAAGTIPNVYFFPNTTTSSLEGTLRSGSAYSVTSAAAMTGASKYTAYGPSAIVCKGHVGKPVVLILGDSIASNSNETQNGYTDGVSGFIPRGLYAAATPIYCANFAVPGTGPSQWTHNTEGGDYVVKAKFDLLTLITTANGGTLPFSHIITEHGTNSVNGLATNTTGTGGTPNAATSGNTLDNLTGQAWDTPSGFLAGMIAYAGLVKATFPGKPLIQTTLIPKGTTSDGWATLANQTPNAATVAQGNAFNASVRSNLASGAFDGYIDAQALCGDPSDATKWKLNSFSTTLAADYISNTKGTATGATTNAAGYAQGATVITLASAGTGTIRVGDNITFAGDTNPYIVTAGSANVSAGGAITIHTGLAQALPATAKAITIGAVGTYCVLNAPVSVGETIVMDPTGVGNTVSTGGSTVEGVTYNGNGTWKVFLSGVRTYASPVTAGTTVIKSYTRDGTHPDTAMHKLIAPAVTRWASDLASMNQLMPPAGLDWMPPIAITRTGSVYATNFNITSLIPAATKIYYVDPVNGSDANAGTTRGAPLIKLSTALLKTDVDQIRIINLTSDFLARGTRGWNGAQCPRSVSVIVEGNYRFATVRMAQDTAPTWTAYDAPTHTYQATIQTTDVCDAAYWNAATWTDVNGNTVTSSTAPKEIRRLVKVASIAAVQATAGTWYFDGSIVYVRAHDDRSLIGDTLMCPLQGGGNNGRPNLTTNDLVTYVQGVDFVGGQGFFDNKVSTVTGQVLAFNNCSFQCAGSGQAGGLSIKAASTVYTYRCGAYNNYLDGINYHSQEQNAGVTMGTSPSFIEVENVAYGNGMWGSVGTTDNCTTCHDDCHGVRLNGQYAYSSDRPLHDIDKSRSWNLGCFVGPAVDSAMASIVSGVGGSTNVMYIDGCPVRSLANAKVQADGSAFLYYANMTGLTNAGTGTMAAYTP